MNDQDQNTSQTDQDLTGAHGKGEPGLTPPPGDQTPPAVYDPAITDAPGPDAATTDESGPLPEPDAPLHLSDLYHSTINKIRAFLHAEEIRVRDDVIADVEAITLHEDDHPLLAKYKADVLAYLRSFTD